MKLVSSCYEVESLRNLRVLCGSAVLFTFQVINKAEIGGPNLTDCRILATTNETAETQRTQRLRREAPPISKFHFVICLPQTSRDTLNQSANIFAEKIFFPPTDVYAAKPANASEIASAIVKSVAYQAVRSVVTGKKIKRWATTAAVVKARSP